MDFFGISGGNKEEDKASTPRPGEDEEDYWENAKSEKPTTNPIGVEENTSTSVLPTTEDIEGSGEEHIIPEEHKLEKPAVAQAAKTVEKSIIEDELIVDKKLEKLSEAKDVPKAEEKKTEESAVETTSVEPTKAETTEKVEPEAPKKKTYIDVLERNMEKLEKIVDAVEKMIDPVEGLKVVDVEVPESEITSRENKEAKEVSFGNSAEFVAPVFGTYHPRAPHQFNHDKDEMAVVDGIMLGMLNHLLSFNRMAFMGVR